MTDSPRDERDPLGLLPDFHRTTRMPLDAVVRLHFEGTVAYQNGFAANVSALGMFVKHPDPPAIGTRLVFEFVLGNERKPVQGGGTVSWVRERYEGPGRPAGVGIRFTELDALSRQHIAESLFEYLETQLGVEVADHPDVPNLLAAMPSSTSYEIAPTDDAEPAEPPQAELSFAPEPLTAEPALRVDDLPPFRLFGDEPPSAAAASDDDTLTGEPRANLFRPVAPPEDLEPPSPEAYYGRAKRRDTPPWLPVVIVMALIAAGLSGWWYVWGPGGESATVSPAATAVEPTPAPPPERPRLDPQPGPEATLAETVGAGAAAPIADGPDTAAEDLTPEPAATAPPAAIPLPGTPRPPLTRVTDISWATSDVGTDVVLRADGAFGAGSFRWFEIRDDRPRVLVRISGVHAGYPRTSLTAGTAELSTIRIGYHEKAAGNELHVVLDLAARGVLVSGVDSAADRLTIRLRQP